MIVNGLGVGIEPPFVRQAAFAAPVGTPSTVTSTILCMVDFSDVFLPGWPGSIQLTGRGSAALDTYRSR